MMKTAFIFLLFVIAASAPAYGQDASEEFKPELRGAIIMGNTHSPTANIDGKHIIVIPTWGIDFDYRFHKRWSADLQSDVKIQSFAIEDGDIELKRTNPVTLVVALHYYTFKHLSFFAGPGYELEINKSLYMLKLGTEYSFEISKDFEIGLALMYENKEGIYDAWTLGVAFNKKLWRKQ